MFTSILILTLINVIQSQNSTKNLINSVNCSGLYFDPLNLCFYKLFSDPVIFTLDNTNTNYFFWKPTESQHSISITIQNLDDIQRQLAIAVKIQQSDSVIIPTNFHTIIPEGDEKHKVLILENLAFCRTPDGFYCRMIVALKLNAVQPVKVAISVHEIETNISLFIPILIVLAIIFVILGIVLTICLIKAKYCNRVHSLEIIKNQLDYFEQYLPQVPFKQLKLSDKKDYEQIQTCAVCLGDLMNDHVVRKTLCDHVFHTECLIEWCKNKLICPMCRQTLDQENLKQKTKEKQRQLDKSSMLNFIKTEEIDDKVCHYNEFTKTNHTRRGSHSESQEEIQ